MIDIFITKFCRLIKKCDVTDNKILLSDLDDLFAIVTDMKSSLDNGVICSNREDVAIFRSSMNSTWIKQMLKEMFIFKVCLDLIRPPLVIFSCCKQPLGCELCIDTWLESSSQYPHCRTDNFASMNLNCFDDDINELRKL